MYKLGLIGNPISHSFSKEYFNAKFKNKSINNFSYSLYKIKNIQKLDELIMCDNLIGLNVTRPHKTDIIQYLDQLDNQAKKEDQIRLAQLEKQALDNKPQDNQP